MEYHRLKQIAERHDIRRFFLLAEGDFDPAIRWPRRNGRAKLSHSTRKLEICQTIFGLPFFDRGLREPSQLRLVLFHLGGNQPDFGDPFGVVGRDAVAESFQHLLVKIAITCVIAACQQ